MKNLSKIELSVEAYNTLQRVIRSLYDSKTILDEKLNAIHGSNGIPEDNEFLNYVRLKIRELIDTLEAV